jgi:hypothetical protein
MEKGMRKDINMIKRCRLILGLLRKARHKLNKEQAAAYSREHGIRVL